MLGMGVVSAVSKYLDLIGKSESLTQGFHRHRKLMFEDVAIPEIFYATADAMLRYVYTGRADRYVVHQFLLGNVGKVFAPEDIATEKLKLEFRDNAITEVLFWWGQGLGSPGYRKLSERKLRKIRELAPLFSNFPEMPNIHSDHYMLLNYIHSTPCSQQYIKAGYRTLADIKALVDNDIDMELVRSIG